MTVTAFPLHWPVERPRRPSHQRESSAFGTSMAKARDALFKEVDLLGGRNVVLSSNVPLRLDGRPYANFPAIADPAVAVYFTYREKPMCFACDRWNKVEDNMQAVRKTIEALRGIARWGTGDMLQAAFTGFTALPAPAAARDWQIVLELQGLLLPTREDIDQAYRRLASKHHPDKGGTAEKMAEINRARAEALQFLEAA